MDTLKAFALGAAARAAGNEAMVFYWDKAAALIKKKKPEWASAGLSGDWDWTGDCIYEEGKPVTDSYTYLASIWATPELNMDGKIVACWKPMKETSWDSDTKWPASALKILEEEG